MKAQRQSEINGERLPQSAVGVRGRTRLAAEYDDGLYRYVPVPPVYRDADGYPIEDGMSQNENHQEQTAHWCYALKRHLPTATVCSDLPVHYRRGDRNRAIVPDLFVALRAPRLGSRPSYKLWENPVPDLAMEMLSPSNWEEDVGPKLRTYEHLGVRECWLFDPDGHSEDAALIGYRLHGERYRRIAKNAVGRLPSEVLGLELRMDDGRLRFHDPATGEDLKTFDEEADGRAAAEQRATAAERELARLRLRLAEVEKPAVPPQTPHSRT